MAGAINTNMVPIQKPDNHWMYPGEYLIKNAEIINNGDLIGGNTSGTVQVATNATGAIVKPLGAAFFDQDNIGLGALTGDGSTITTGIASRCSIGTPQAPVTSTLVPGLAKFAPLYLGPVPTTTVSNYTCNIPNLLSGAAAGTAIIPVGFVSADAFVLHVIVTPDVGLQSQASGNSIINWL